MRTTTGLAALALLTTLAACSSGDDEDRPDGKQRSDTSPAVERDTTDVEPAWRLQLDAIAQPEVADGVALVVTRTPGRSLTVVAADVETGEKLWSRPWSPGAIPPGYSMGPATFESASGRAVTVFSVPPRDLGARSLDMWRLPLVVVDLASGKELHRTKRVELLTPPVPCADEKDACLELRDHTGGLRLDLDTGRLAPDPTGTPDGARSIGEAGLFATSNRPGEALGVAREGKTLWTRPIEQVMGQGVSSDTGWSFSYDEDTDRYVGWMRKSLPPEAAESAQAGRKFSYDFGIYRLVAFDGSDGKVLWSRKGAEHSCLGITTDTPRVRCLIQGEVTYSSGGKLIRVEGGSATVEGFDPETGEARWSVPVARDAVPDLIDDREQKVALGDTGLVETEQGPRVVDLATGKTAEPADDEVFVCATENRTFEYAMPIFIDGDPITRRYGGQLLRPCTADGADAAAYTTAAVTDGGRDADNDRHVLASAEGLLGFDLGD